MTKHLFRLLSAALLVSAAPSFAAIAHEGSATGRCSSSTTFTGNIASAADCADSATTIYYTYTPTGAGHLILFAVNCTAATPPTGVTAVGGTGWNLRRLYGPTGYSNWGTLALFWTLAPDATANTITVTWTGGSGCQGLVDDYIDEFSGHAVFNIIDNQSMDTGTTGGCSATVPSITPSVDGDAIWSLCYVDSISAVGSGFTKSVDDTQGDWTEFQILTGGGGTPQALGWSSSGQYVTFNVAIAPFGANLPNRNMPAAAY